MRPRKGTNDVVNHQFIGNRRGQVCVNKSSHLQNNIQKAGIVESLSIGGSVSCPFPAMRSLGGWRTASTSG